MQDQVDEAAGLLSINAVTLATHDMARAVAFYQALGFVLHFGGGDAPFTSFAVGGDHLNLVAAAPGVRWSWWGRVIFYLSDVDAMYRRAVTAGFATTTIPADASWGERFFQLLDPDGHELSFAAPLRSDVDG
jgi:uncharacterized glyoxalase superfamily protein PhnB